MDRALTIADVKMLRAEMQVAELAAMVARSWMYWHEGNVPPDPLSAGYWRRQAEGAEQILARAGRKVTEVEA